MKVTYISFVAILLALFVNSQMAGGEEMQSVTNAPISVNELMYLLPAGPDIDSPLDHQRLQTLRSIGPGLLPVIAEAIDNSPTMIQTSRLIALAEGIPGDHSPLIPRLYKLLDSGAEAKILALMALRNIGSGSDCPILLPLLEDPNEAVRINTAQTLARLGDEKTMGELKRVVKSRRAKLSAEELRKDYSISEAEKAIIVLQKKSNISEKVAEKGKVQ